MKNVSLVITILLISSLVIITPAAIAHAGIWGSSVEVIDLLDSRNMTKLLGSWSGFVIAWNISETYANSGIWNYSYTLGNTHDVSNFMLELSGDTVISNISVNGAYALSGPKTWTKSGNVVLPNSLFGINFETDDINPVTYSFQSASDPVWGNFHARDGVGYTAYNSALEFSLFDSINTDDFIVRPNGGASPPVVPEPIGAMLFISGGILFAVTRLVLGLGMESHL